LPYRSLAAADTRCYVGDLLVEGNLEVLMMELEGVKLSVHALLMLLLLALLRMRELGLIPPFLLPSPSPPSSFLILFCFSNTNSTQLYMITATTICTQRIRTQRSSLSFTPTGAPRSL
jgi:hypothetical protein